MSRDVPLLSSLETRMVSSWQGWREAESPSSKLAMSSLSSFGF